MSSLNSSLLSEAPISASLCGGDVRGRVLQALWKLDQRSEFKGSITTVREYRPNTLQNRLKILLTATRSLRYMEVFS